MFYHAVAYIQMQRIFLSHGQESKLLITILIIRKENQQGLVPAAKHAESNLNTTIVFGYHFSNVF